MLQRTFEVGLNLAWVTSDSIYGDDRTLRQWLESHNQPFMLAVSGKEAVWLDPHQRQVKLILAELPVDGWEKLSAGAGSKGPRWYAWRQLELNDPPERDWKRWLLV